MNDTFLTLVIITTIVDAILVGAVLDYAIKQLPARKIIGMVAYRKYFVASDLGNGRFWYVPLGLSSYGLNVAVAVWAYYMNGLSSSSFLFLTAAIFALIHAFGTSQAVPAGLRFLKLKTDDEAILAKSFDKFAIWVMWRAIFGFPMFLAMLFGLILIS